MKPTACIETSVVSYLCARPSRGVVVAAYRQVTRDGWRIATDWFDPVASAPVVAEAGAGDAQAAQDRLAETRGEPLAVVGEFGRDIGETGRGAVLGGERDPLAAAPADTHLRALDLLKFAHNSIPKSTHDFST